MDAMHIFRAGTHTAMSGETLDFGEADLAAMAAAYDPALHEAPIVVGHPRTDAPAYGWIGALHARGGDLFARPAQVEPAFAEMVRAGRFKKISAAFYPPRGAANPKPGVYYLKHVGFLGAQPPAVKGLRAVELAQDAEAVTVEIEFGEAELAGMSVFGFAQLRGIVSALRDWLLSSQGSEIADRVVPAETLEGIRTTEEFLRDAAQRAEEAGSDMQEFGETRLSRALNARLDARSDGDTQRRSELIDRMASEAGIDRGTVLQILSGEIETPPEKRLRGFARVLGISADSLMELVELAEETHGKEAVTMPERDSETIQAEIARRESELAAREAAFAEREAKTRRAEDAALIEGLVRDGRLAPGLRDEMLGFMASLEAQAEVAFAEGAAKTSPRAWFRKLMAERAQPLIRFGEVSAPDGAPARISGADDVAAAARRLMKEAEAEGRTLTFAEAARAVEAQMETQHG